LNKEIAAMFVALACVGVIATVGIFLPSQIVQQQAAENKTWHLKQSYDGQGDMIYQIQIDSETWRISWGAYVMKGFEQYASFSVSVFDEDNVLLVYAAPELGWRIENQVLLAGTDYIIYPSHSSFTINVRAEYIQVWSIYIYEYK